MENNLYKSLKQLASFSHLPCTILSVEKNPDGTCGDVRFFAVNELFKKSYYELFLESHRDASISFEDYDEVIEGKHYTAHLPKEPKFEEICFRAAWKNEMIHTYVDTTKMYGFWTEDIVVPIICDHDDKVAYCQFMYTLNREMDTGKFSSVSPDISSFVIKTCLELRNEKDFSTSINTVTNDIREYTDSRSACIITIDRDQNKFTIISESVTDNEYLIKNVFSAIPYEIVASWEKLVKETNCIIIKNKKEMDLIKEKAPDWVESMLRHDVKNLCLFPFTHRGTIIGYLYITNFNIENIIRIKETIELVSFFLTSEVANHIIMDKLEYLSNIDMLTGVYNRNCMNINVDELSLKLKLNPAPFTVAFFDLNGLKTINDNGGHNAGDQLLKDAANILKEVFSEDKIYRAGGDEFVVISTNSTEDEFLAKLSLIREKACNPDWLNFAIGHYHDAKDGDLRLAMRYADENMYEDKNAFYDLYPKKRR